MKTAHERSYTAAELNTQEVCLPTVFDPLVMQRPRSQMLAQALESPSMAQSAVHAPAPAHTDAPNRTLTATELDALLAPEENPFAAFAAVFAPRRTYRAQASGNLPEWMQHAYSSSYSDRTTGAAFKARQPHSGTHAGLPDGYDAPVTGDSDDHSHVGGFDDSPRPSPGMGQSVAWAGEDTRLQGKGSFPHKESTAMTDAGMWGGVLSVAPSSTADSILWDNAPPPALSNMIPGDGVGSGTHSSTSHRRGSAETPRPTTRFSGMPPTRGCASQESPRPPEIPNWRSSLDRSSAYSHDNAGVTPLARLQTHPAPHLNPDAIAEQLNNRMSAPTAANMLAGGPGRTPALVSPTGIRSPTGIPPRPLPVGDKEVPAWRSQVSPGVTTSTLNSPTAGWRSPNGPNNSVTLPADHTNDAFQVSSPLPSPADKPKPVGRWSQRAAETTAKRNQEQTVAAESVEGAGMQTAAAVHRTMTIRRPTSAPIKVTTSQVVSAVGVMALNTVVLISLAVVLNKYLTN